MICIYMVVSQDQYRLPMYWGESMEELARNARISYEAVLAGFRRLYKHPERISKYEKVLLPEDREEAAGCRM